MSYISTEFYDQHYKDLHEDVIKACDCITSKPSSALSEKMDSIVNVIKGMNLKQNSWTGDIADDYDTTMDAVIGAINEVKSSIDTTFKNAENSYKDLKNELDSFKKCYDEYIELVGKEPILESAKYEYYVNDKDENGVSYQKKLYDNEAWGTDHNSWLEDVQSKEDDCKTYKITIDNMEKTLSDIDTEAIKLNNSSNSSVTNLSKLNLGNMFILPNNLPIDSQLEYITSGLGWVGASPFNTRYTQSNIPGVSFAGGPLNSTGCAGVAFNHAIACALTDEYGVPIDIGRGDFLKKIYKDNGSGSTTYGTEGYSWTPRLPKDITNSFKDVSIIQLKSNYNGVLNYDEIKKITDAGGIIVESIKGESHFGTIYGVNDAKKTVYFNDPGFQGNSEVKVGARQLNYKGTKKGDVSGKAVWIVFGNKHITGDSTTVSVEGLDLGELNSGVEAFYTNGNKYDVSVNGDGSLNVPDLQNNVYSI